jgi:hypothetical protein
MRKARTRMSDDELIGSRNARPEATMRKVTPIPRRMLNLPRDERGFVVPWFAWHDDTGRPHISVLDKGNGGRRWATIGVGYVASRSGASKRSLSARSTSSRAPSPSRLRISPAPNTRCGFVRSSAIRRCGVGSVLNVMSTGIASSATPASVLLPRTPACSRCG